MDKIIENLIKDDISKIVNADRLKIIFPKVIKVKQKFNSYKTEDIQGTLAEQFERIKMKEQIKPAMSIAIGVGSRGITNLAEIVYFVVEEVKKLGAKPFIIPAMGSHGGATAIGQKKILENYGITEKKVKAPILSSMEVVQIGRYQNKINIYFDKNAYHADGIIPINRIKYHTDFRGIIESGLIKMLAIGFGKQTGAAEIHSLGKEKFPNSILEIGLKIIEKMPIIAGIACIEDAYNHLAALHVLTKEEIFPQERELLKKVKSMMSKIKLSDIDVLIIDEMGKNISGTGFDPNIIGRFRGIQKNDIVSPIIKQVVILRLTEETEGNACGIGYADITVKKLVEKINFSTTYTNTFTGGSGDLFAIKLPVVMNNDEDAIALAIKLSYCQDSQQAKIVRIKNTNQLGEMIISEKIYEEIKERQDFEIIGGFQSIIFNQSRNLL
jgi:hypothetical protein